MRLLGLQVFLLQKEKMYLFETNTVLMDVWRNGLFFRDQCELTYHAAGRIQTLSLGKSTDSSLYEYGIENVTVVNSYKLQSMGKNLYS